MHIAVITFLYDTAEVSSSAQRHDVVRWRAGGLGRYSAISLIQVIHFLTPILSDMLHLNISHQIWYKVLNKCIILLLFWVNMRKACVAVQQSVDWCHTCPLAPPPHHPSFCLTETVMDTRTATAELGWISFPANGVRTICFANLCVSVCV